MRAELTKAVSAVTVTLLLGGCGLVQRAHWNDDLRRRAAFELRCGQDLKVTPLDGNEYFPKTQGVEGCGKRAVYVYSDGKWLLNAPLTESAPDAASAPSHAEAPAGGVAQPPSPAAQP